MALPELIEAFERDTVAELAAIRAAAESDARAIDADAARARGERIASAALHRSRADIYAHRTAMLDRLRAEVELQLVALVASVGDSLLRVAIACAGDEPGTLHCTPTLALRARALAPASLQVAATAVEHRAQADADVAAALHRSRADIYAHRTAMLDRLRAEVERQLVALVASVGDALLRVAIACAGDEPGTLHCTPTLALRARALAPASLQVAADEAVATGVIIELASGTHIDATLARLLDREWAQLSGDAVRLIAKEES